MLLLIVGAWPRRFASFSSDCWWLLRRWWYILFRSWQRYLWGRLINLLKHIIRSAPHQIALDTFVWVMVAGHILRAEYWRCSWIDLSESFLVRAIALNIGAGLLVIIIVRKWAIRCCKNISTLIMNDLILNIYHWPLIIILALVPLLWIWIAVPIQWLKWLIWLALVILLWIAISIDRLLKLLISFSIIPWLVTHIDSRTPLLLALLPLRWLALSVLSHKIG